MATAVIDGIATRYEVRGSGPALLMFSPGGFDATLEKWSTLGIYAKVKPLEALEKKYSCIVFDRRETGQSGGRVEAIGWAQYVAQGKGLLDHLGIESAHLMGGCMGCCPVAAFVASHPKRVASAIFWWPVGGARYRIKGHARFSEHLAYVKAEGLGCVVALAKSEGKAFGADPRVGPWAAPIRTDAKFADAYAKRDRAGYEATVRRMADNLLDRDTAPGAEPEDLMRASVPTLIVPGRDESHATSAARYLEECIPGAQYWDVPPEGQTAESAPPRLLEFLDSASRK
jgi:pimeloyl-ACP methyl ester carboxylesterase